MRRIEENMLDAIRSRKNWKESNTEVRVTNEENGGQTVAVYLHGNEIYEVYENLWGAYVRQFTLAGWNTTTTRSRLRALGVDVRQRAGRAIYDGTEINNRNFYDVK